SADLGNRAHGRPQHSFGVDQTVLHAFSMLVVVALIGTTDLGQGMWALGLADLLIQGFAHERREAFGP
ncbi:hypothetical protein, partial [Falsirhodobacter xinxiangensis]|uniref:hypothetical protein n=1 Tax=Falsirhodobacter xinxiangensis TaxID=2530049 RepID=UPI001C704DCC